MCWPVSSQENTDQRVKRKDYCLSAEENPKKNLKRLVRSRIEPVPTTTVVSLRVYYIKFQTFIKIRLDIFLKEAYIDGNYQLKL